MRGPVEPLQRVVAAAAAVLAAAYVVLPVLHLFESDHCEAHCPVCLAIAVIAACVITVAVRAAAFRRAACRVHSPALVPVPGGHPFPLHQRPPPALP